MMERSPAGPKQRHGFVLIAMCACMFLLLAAIGLAFDLGRIYIVRNEGQIFVDAAALAASAQLDGTTEGLARARAAVAKLPGRWNLAAESFKGVTLEFSADGSAWGREPRDSSVIQLARVTAPSNPLEMTFVQAIGGPLKFNVATYAIASANPVRLIE